MCGICGFVDKRSSRDDKQAIIVAMMETMRHRGPDDGGAHVADQTALGFRRLSIIDVAAGRQPLANEDGRLQLVFNGEIYNYRTLRAELVAKGHRFETESDSEVVIHLFEEEGIRGVRRLRGMFAFVIWDNHSKELYGARDRFGIKPFYYTQQGERFIFASEAKAILKHPAVRPALDPVSLQHYFTFQYVPDPYTMFTGIKNLPPAHYFRFANGSLMIHRYWQLEFKPELKQADYFISGTQHLLQEAVDMHMMGEVPKGAFLSSGIDSSIIAALMCQREPTRTFSIGYNEPAYSELPHARRTAEYLGAHQHEMYLSGRELWQELPRIVWHMDEPVADPAACSLYFVSSLAAQAGLKVVLSGEGADEAFAGYGIYREPGDLRRFHCLPRPIQILFLLLAAMPPPEMRGKNYVRRATTPLAERYFGNALIFSEAQKQRLLRLDSSERVPPTVLTAPYYAATGHLDDISQMQYVDFHTWLVGDILTKADRMSMAHSLELRVPFLDHELVEFAATIPVDLKISENMTKYVLRQAARAWLPPEAATRPKRGFPVPTREWLKSSWREPVHELFNSGVAGEYVDLTYAKQLFAEHLAGRKDHSRQLWSIIVFQHWYSIFI